jgi:hypothetical protein
VKRILGGSIVLFAFGLGVAQAVPARPLYEPVEYARPTATAATVTVNLNGSAWLGKYGAANRTYVFEADGTLSYKSAAVKGNLFKNRGTWKLEGNVLTFEHFIGKNKVQDFRGIVKDANTIVGEQTLKTGAQSPMTMQRTTLEVK